MRAFTNKPGTENSAKLKLYMFVFSILMVTTTGVKNLVKFWITESRESGSFLKKLYQDIVALGALSAKNIR